MEITHIRQFRQVWDCLERFSSCKCSLPSSLLAGALGLGGVIWALGPGFGRRYLGFRARVWAAAGARRRPHVGSKIVHSPYQGAMVRCAVSVQMPGAAGRRPDAR